MRKQFKNEFLNNTVGKTKFTRVNFAEMHFVDSGNRTGGACYYSLDHVKPNDDTWVWTPPCKTKDPHNNDIGLVSWYNRHAYFDPKSPWSPIIDAMAKEMFEGYPTTDERLELVNEIGFVVGPKVMKQFTKVTLCSFLTFWRRAFEFNGVRYAFKAFLEDPKTKYLPLQWNVFAAHHILANKSGQMSEERWENWHNNFNPKKYPKTAVAFLTKQVSHAPEGFSWFDKFEGTFMSGKSDALFGTVAVKGPTKFETPALWDHSGYNPKRLIENVSDYNLEVFNKNVQPYI
jgi:hypothetical protein